MPSSQRIVSSLLSSRVYQADLLAAARLPLQCDRRVLSSQLVFDCRELLLLAAVVEVFHVLLKYSPFVEFAAAYRFACPTRVILTCRLPTTAVCLLFRVGIRPSRWPIHIYAAGLVFYKERGQQHLFLADGPASLRLSTQIKHKLRLMPDSLAACTSLSLAEAVCLNGIVRHVALPILARLVLREHVASACSLSVTCRHR